jgi:hypothetical protein
MTTARHPQLHRLLFDEEPLIDEGALERLIEQLGQQRGPDSLYALRELTRALARCAITLPLAPADHGFDLRAAEVCQRTFWQLIALGLAHDLGEAALIMRDALALNLSVQKHPSIPHRIRFKPDARGAAGSDLNKQLDLRIIASPDVAPDERLRTAIAAFPHGAASLGPLLASYPQPELFAPDVVRLFWVFAGHPALPSPLLDAAWRATRSVETRIALLRDLEPRQATLDHANAAGWGALLVAAATDDRERVALLAMRRHLHDVRWSEVACALLGSQTPHAHARALETLEESASRDAIPALAAARADASRADRRRIDAILAGIHLREPMPGDGDGALSLSEAVGGELSQAGEQGALSVVDAGGALGQLVVAERAPHIQRLAAALLLLILLCVVVMMIFVGLS